MVDLTVAIDDGVREIIAGLSEQYTFEVVVANRGPSIARELLITDRLPADTQSLRSLQQPVKWSKVSMDLSGASSSWEWMKKYR